MIQAGSGALLAGALSGALGGVSGAAAATLPAPPEGAAPAGATASAFDTVRFPARLGEAPRSLSGRVESRAWQLSPGEAAGLPSPAAITRAYAADLSGEGFGTLLDCVDSACGGVALRFTLPLLPPPDMLIDTADLALLVMQGQVADGEATLLVVVSRVLGTLYLQITQVVPEGAEPLGFGADPLRAPAARIPQPVAAGTLPVGAEEEAETRAGAAATPSEDTMAGRLRTEGHVALDGVDFETGRAVLSAGSAAVVDQVAAMLTADPDLSVAIVGHSDNEGALEGNIALSRARAEAVREALIARGIVPARLEAHGVGWLAPLASNATPAGRARNRRVELVPR